MVEKKENTLKRHTLDKFKKTKEAVSGRAVFVRCISGKDLIKKDKDSSDSYIKISINGKKQVQRTDVITSLNPKWNNDFVFSVTNFKEDSLHFDVFDQDKLVDGFMGKIVFPCSKLHEIPEVNETFDLLDKKLKKKFQGSIVLSIAMGEGATQRKKNIRLINRQEKELTSVRATLDLLNANADEMEQKIKVLNVTVKNKEDHIEQVDKKCNKLESEKMLLFSKNKSKDLQVKEMIQTVKALQKQLEEKDKLLTFAGNADTDDYTQIQDQAGIQTQDGTIVNEGKTKEGILRRKIQEMKDDQLLILEHLDYVSGRMIDLQRDHAELQAAYQELQQKKGGNSKASRSSWKFFKKDVNKMSNAYA